MQVYAVVDKIAEQSRTPMKTRKSCACQYCYVWLRFSNSKCGSQLVSWCFEPSQLQRITSTKDYIRSEHKLYSISKSFISQVTIPQVMFQSNLSLFSSAACFPFLLFEENQSQFLQFSAALWTIRVGQKHDNSSGRVALSASFGIFDGIVYSLNLDRERDLLKRYQSILFCISLWNFIWFLEKIVTKKRSCYRDFFFFARKHTVSLR